MSKDYYKILGIDKSASADEIKKAFRKLAHEHHPDKKHGNEEKFKEINEAYQVLSDQKKRAQYDQFGSGFENMNGGFGGGAGGYQDFANGFQFNMDDLGDMFGGFGDMFGFGGGAKRAAKRSRGEDIYASLSISFAEAVTGIEKDISLERKMKCNRCDGSGAEPGSKIDTCPVCHGSGQVVRAQRTIFGNVQMRATCENCHGEGKTFEKKCTACKGHGVASEMTKIKVKIPAGIDDGDSIRLAGYGEAGERGNPSGDLFLKIRVASDKRFVREGSDIRTKSEISFSQAALGDVIKIETVRGVEKLKIPAGTQSGTVFRMKGMGMNDIKKGGKGDHFVEVHVKTPTSLNREQKKLFEELMKI